MKVTRKISINKEERKVLDEFFNMCNEIGLEDIELVDLLDAISNKDSEFYWAGDPYDIEYTD